MGGKIKMTNKFKIGDKVRAKSNCTNDIGNGEGIIESMDEYGDFNIRITKQSRHYSVGSLTSHTNWGRHVELIEGRRGRKVKVKPEELHVVLVDSCRNFVGESACRSYEDAEVKAKGCSEKQTIYRLVKIADVESIRQVKKVRQSRAVKIVRQKKKQLYLFLLFILLFFFFLLFYCYV